MCLNIYIAHCKNLSKALITSEKDVCMFMRYREKLVFCDGSFSLFDINEL